MARIRDRKGRSDTGAGYTRLLGIPALGQLLSRIHATVIRPGKELERLLADQCPFRAERRTERLRSCPQAGRGEGREAFFGEQIPVRGRDRHVGFDIVLLDHWSAKAQVIEEKDGDTFDTKKANGEGASLRAVADTIAEATGYAVEIYFCCFNQEN